jgi:hypothetical protein
MGLAILPARWLAWPLAPQDNKFVIFPTAGCGVAQLILAALGNSCVFWCVNKLLNA